MSNLRMHYPNILHAGMKVNQVDNKYQNGGMVTMTRLKVEDASMGLD